MTRYVFCLNHNFHAFVLCSSFSSGCECASYPNKKESSCCSWTQQFEIMDAGLICHQMTTYPRLVGDASCQKYRSDKALPTHCFLIIGDVTGAEAFRAVFTSLSLGVFDQRRSALARWWDRVMGELDFGPSCTSCRRPMLLGSASVLSIKFHSYFEPESGVSILMSYGENPHYVKLPIFSEFMENSTKFMKNSDLTKWTQNLR